MNYAGLTPYLVNALQEIASISGQFKANLIAWLGSAENGITDLFAKNLHAENIYADHGFFSTLTASSTITGKELCAEKSDGTPICITGDELSSLLSGSNAG